MIGLSVYNIIKVTAQRNWHSSCQVIELKITNKEGHESRITLFSNEAVIPMQIEWIDGRDYRDETK
tara:strand:+ start:261 stop:458 length:198 start_codon:yes stop_codon:yes gene_type:complete